MQTDILLLGDGKERNLLVDQWKNEALKNLVYMMCTCVCMHVN